MGRALEEVVERLVDIVLTMLAVSFLVYAVLEVNVDDVAVKTLGQFSTAVQRAQWLHENGYDAPFFTRYLRWLAHFVAGEWGNSTHFRTPVLELIPSRLEATGLLGGAALLVTVPVSLVLGAVAGLREGRPADTVISLFSIVTTSVPEFASAAFLAAIFVFWLGLLPGASTMNDGFSPRQLVLPALVLALSCTGYLVRITRASVAETARMPFVRTARLKGASPLRIVVRHVLRNALVAPVTVILLYVPWLVSGVIVVEVFFAYPGFGSLLYEAGLNSDIALIEACAIVSVLVVVVSQFLSDVLLLLLSPRLREQGMTQRFSLVRSLLRLIRRPALGAAE